MKVSSSKLLNATYHIDSLVTLLAEFAMPNIGMNFGRQGLFWTDGITTRLMAPNCHYSTFIFKSLLGTSHRVFKSIFLSSDETARREQTLFLYPSHGFDLIHVNYLYGTSVLGTDQRIIKVYSKNTNFYAHCYEFLRTIHPSSIHIKGDILILFQERFQRNTHFLDYNSILVRLPRALASLHLLANNLDDLMKEKLRVRNRVQMLQADLSHSQSPSSLYQHLALELESRASDFEIQLCHGDVWEGNIMCRNGQELVLIDFDKLVLFTPEYDYIYLAIMSDKRLRRAMIHGDVEWFPNHLEELNRRLGANLNTHQKKGLKLKIRLGVALFALFRHIEMDSQNGQHASRIEQIFHLCLRNER